MKVLWVVNITMPEVSQMMNEKANPFGGWLVNASQILAQDEKIELMIACPSNINQDFKKFNQKNITYYTFPNRFLNVCSDEEVIALIKDATPNIIHLHGTEYHHTYCFIKAANVLKIKSVVSIQGLIHKIADYYMADLPLAIQKRYTIRDFLRKDNLTLQQAKYVERGVVEINSIKEAHDVIGRTKWDYSTVNEMNPNIQYYLGEETMRQLFYQYKWNIEEINRYSLFLSQGSLPMKGLHKILEALSYIKKIYPNACLYIGGDNRFASHRWTDLIKASSYDCYVRRMIKKQHLDKHIKFLGMLEENEVVNRLLQTHVAINASSIENSSNAICEAMLLGVPVVASSVGGTVDLIEDGVSGLLYPFSDAKRMAECIMHIFADDGLAIRLGENAQKKALEKHDPIKNKNRLIDIYTTILNQ